MPDGSIFISHVSADDAFVADLRAKLEALRLPVWVDSRDLRGGSKLASEIEHAIEHARQFIVVLSPNTVNAPWVRREIKKALEVEQRRKAEGYRVIALLLPGITPGALHNWFDEEPVAVTIASTPRGLSEAVPEILAALGERLPTDHQAFEQADAKPLEELVLSLTDPKIETHEGKRRVTATATLIYEPANPALRRVESKRFTFTAPLGPIEADDLRWYLESYFLWPVGVFKARAEGIEKKLPQWGQDLFKTALGADAARNARTAWQHSADSSERRFSVEVDRELPEGAPADAQTTAAEAATEFLALPWELLHDGRGWLFQGKHAARVRRRLPNRQAQPARPTALPVRILLLSPRPEKDGEGGRIGYIDHRISARPLTDAVENLGELARLTVLNPPTYAALEKALQEAADRHEAFDVVHFDGHGVYDRRLGLGGLCFEDPKDESKLEQRKMDFVDAAKLAGLFRQHRIPLVFLEACQTAKTEKEPTASVAAKLLEEGVTSVAAMSHSVLVETARRFVQAFYAELARGARVGQAMLAGQQALFGDTARGKIMGAGELRLQDWFVPVLYQEKQDPQLITQVAPQQVRQLETQERKLNLGALPEEPAHKFQGRSRELLALERLLHRQPWAVVRGTGGQGKTTLAVELARWLTRTARFTRAAFVSLEEHRDARAVLDTLGRQLLPDGDKYSVAQFRDLKEALQPVERALADHATIIVFDNCESVLPIAQSEIRDSQLDEILSLSQRLLDAAPRTRLVFTSRESLPPPFDQRGRERELGALDRTGAIELVSQVMAQEGLVPASTDPGSTPKEIEDLVEAVNCHARALVLLAREVARRGVAATTDNLRALMADLERKHPRDRENSLYASVELSLRRLPSASRERIKVLGVCQGGVQVTILAMLTELEPNDVRQLAIELIDVGLGEDVGDGHLRLDPGLPPYLLGETTAAEVDATRSRWAEAMAQLTMSLYGEQFKDASLAARLTLLELPNILAMLDWLQHQWPPDRVVDLAASTEHLVANLGRPQALAHVTRVREQAAAKLSDWSHGRYTTESANIDRLLEREDLRSACLAARRLVKHCLAAGETAYREAAYDVASAHFTLGKALKKGGAAEEALELLGEAQRRFQQLAHAGDSSAERNISVAKTEAAGCLADLGQLDEAATVYEEGIKRAIGHRDRREEGINRFELGIVRLQQKRYAEALEIFTEARDTFETLREPRQVAAVLHSIGVAHEQAGQLEPAERAYRESLAVAVRENYLASQAATLNQLGNLYGAGDRPEEAATFYRQCVEVCVRLQNPASEGDSRRNLAMALIKLNRYDEARHELHRAIECKKPFSHAAQPWLTWGVLEKLERATIHAGAAGSARQQAIESYLAYRRAGGVSQSNHAELFATVKRAIQQNDAREARQLLALAQLEHGSIRAMIRPHSSEP